MNHIAPTPINAIPESIAKAISECTKSLRMIKKDKKNTHNKYMFASIDDFLEAVGRVMADNSLNVHMDELGVEIVETKSRSGTLILLKTDYEFWFSHADGNEWTKKQRRSTYVQFQAGTATGSSQSYALKQFLRSQFMIATGDKDDVDFQENPKATEKTKKHDPEADRLKQVYATIVSKSKAATNLTDLAELQELYNDDIAAIRQKTDKLEGIIASRVGELTKETEAA